MADKAEITIAGNLRHDVQLTRRDGGFIATTQVCASRRHIQNGALVDHATCLTIEVRGGTDAHAFAAYNRKGSRVVVRGYLEERRASSTQHLPRADGRGKASVLVEHHTLVVVVEEVLADGATLGGQRGGEESRPPSAIPAPSPKQVAEMGALRQEPTDDASTEHQRHARPWNWFRQTE